MTSPGTPSAAEVVRDFLGRGVGNLLRFDPVVRRRRDPEGVHQMRVNVRHLRSELRVAAPALRTEERRRLGRDLRWLGGALGRLRDLDVLAELFALAAKAGVATPHVVTSRLDTQREAQAARVTAALSSRRYRTLLRRLSRAVVDPPLRPGAAAPASNVLGPGLVTVVGDFTSAVDALGATPALEALHALRIKAKRARYNCELAVAFLPSAKRAATALEKVQTVLGDLHDRDVARAYLREVTRPQEMFGGPALDETTTSLAAWLDAEVTRLSLAWPSPVAGAVAALAPVGRALHISSSVAPEVPVK